MAGNATIGALKVVLGLDSAAFTDGLNAAQKHLKGVGQSMQRVGQTMATVGAGMTVAITAPLIAAGFAASKAAAEAADAMGQVEAALSSMGSGAGRTTEQLADLASGIMRNSLYDDDDVLRQVTANLLTFGNVAGTQFDRAQQAAVDLATRMGGDLQSATLMVGKALNSPAEGLAALRRVGIQFTEQQQAQIKAMAKVGDTAGAQAIMLSELERQFGGSAAAAAKTDPYDKLRDALNDLSESAGAVINRFLIPMTTALAGMLDKFNGLSPQMQSFAIAGLAIAAALGPALVVIGSVVGAIGTLTAALAGGGILAGLGAFTVAAGPFVLAAAAIAAAIYVFKDDLAPIFAEFKAAVMDAVGPAMPALMAALKEAVAAIGPAFTALMSVVRPVVAWWAKALADYFGPPILLALRLLAAGFTSTFAIIGQALRVITALLKGDWSGAWNAAGSLVSNIALGIGRVIDAVFPGALAAITRMVDGVKRLLTDLAQAFESAKRKVTEVGDSFYNLWDRVVGHSYIPDMVEGVAAWMAKLDAGMVVPARRATDAAKEAFETLRDDVAGIMESLLTDTERAARDLARQVDIINRAVADPQQGVSRAMGERMIAGVAGQGLTRPTVTGLQPISLEVPKLMTGLDLAFKEASERFGDAFANGIDSALRGDWTGVLQSLFGDVMRNSLKGLGESLFKGASGGGFGGIFKSIAGMFGGGKLPGFKTGGSFRVGGSGGLDSQTVAFRASPGEMVDVRKPGQQMGGGAMAVHVIPSPYFDVQVERVAAGPAARAGSAAFSASRSVIPAEAARRQRYAFG